MQQVINLSGAFFPEGIADLGGGFIEPEWPASNGWISMISEWNTLPESLQLYLAQQAFRQASEAIAGQAEVLAQEFETGMLADRGGAEALRLMAAIVRALGPTNAQPVAYA